MKNRIFIFASLAVTLLLSNCASAPVRELASGPFSAVECVSVSPSGPKYEVSLVWVALGQSMQATVTKDGARIFSGKLVAYQQAFSVDRRTGEKTEYNQYWDPTSDKTRIQIVETYLAQASMIMPDAVNLTCQQPS